LSSTNEAKTETSLSKPQREQKASAGVTTITSDTLNHTLTSVSSKNRPASKRSSKTKQNPLPDLISRPTWTQVLQLADDMPHSFSSLPDSIHDSGAQWSQFLTSSQPHQETLPIPWAADKSSGQHSDPTAKLMSGNKKEKLGCYLFERLLLLKTLRPVSLKAGCSWFVEKVLGPGLNDPIPWSLQEVSLYPSNPIILSIFIIIIYIYLLNSNY